MFVSSLIAAGISLVLIVAGFIGIKKVVSGSLDKERKTFTEQIEGLTTKLDNIAQYGDSYAPKTLLDIIVGKIEGIGAELAKEKAQLTTIETKLDDAQKKVEVKESQQQDVKTAKDEDQAVLENLLATFADLSSESTVLEQKLAQSLKNLDIILAESSLTIEQKAGMQELSNAMTEAGSRLRDLITQHSQITERLSMLKQQHTELEDEYTKLVEKQLGE